LIEPSASTAPVKDVAAVLVCLGASVLAPSAIRASCSTIQEMIETKAEATASAALNRR
jgi:hypothetical protein